ncbi:MAG: 2-succinyl-5-enolpyruvyl-6-hydroxy-3-cyclohexene-1-carboxylic-acid synthase [Chloroflexi bacterium]|nr:MAG: 2-succinyl-5-enolpyruvyl-6-hydroxy-3-cyclohexene-1-carboxylic-acid synthase [Chloroflexota bacterium]
MSAPGDGDLAFACASALVDELARGGLSHACLTPGSRSTPLALAVARHPSVRVHVHVDERSSAFFALGIAKATAAPVAVICTSGTAAANHFPAVIEAFMARVPLVILTADRPPELHGVGANQTIDQQHLYGSFVRWFIDAGVPEDRSDNATVWRSLGARALAAARARPGGPVHVNLPFREPLLPRSDDFALESATGDAPDTVSAPAADGGGSSRLDHEVSTLARHIAGAERGLVIAGALRTPAPEMLPLAAALGWPLIAEPASGLRRATALAAGSLLATDPSWRDGHRADVVLQVGAAPTTRGVQALVRDAGRLVVIDPDELNPVPDRRADFIAHADVSPIATGLAAAIKATPSSAWNEAWRAADVSTRSAVDALLDSWDEPFEGRVARDLAARVPAGGILVVASSMPVRDLDHYMAPRDGLRVLANRGVSGIDGMVSTVLGAAESGAPTYALIGDLALLHDAAGLVWSAGRGHAALLVVVDNPGGGIFSLLPQASLRRDEFEELFGTPHALDLGALASAARAGVSRVEHAHDFAPAFNVATRAGGVQVLHVTVDRWRAVELRERVARVVEQSVAALP